MMDQATLIAILLATLLQQGNKPAGPNSAPRVELRSEIPFSNRDTTRLDRDQRRRLLRAADEIIEVKGSTPGRLIIEGHAAVGAESQALSEQRARLVRRSLETMGVLDQDIQLVDKGLGAQGNKQAVTLVIGLLSG